MQIFINELSLEGQYESLTHFTKAIEVFSAIFDHINLQIQQKQIRYYQLYLNREAIVAEPFKVSFRRLKNPQLRVAFTNNVFNKPNPKPIDWRKERVHSSEDIFECLEDDVVDTSIAEIGERILLGQSAFGLLVNFSDSKFKPHNPLLVKKNLEEQILIPCVESLAALTEWLEANPQLNQPQYAPSSGAFPRDRETILHDTARFVRTNLRPRERVAYREIRTGYYWYIDTQHGDHFEVFDSTGKHLGTADLEGAIDRSQRKAERRISL